MLKVPKEVFCAEVLNGLEEVFIEEIIEITGGNARVIDTKPGFVYFTFFFNIKKLYEVKTAVSIYLVLRINHRFDALNNLLKITSFCEKIIIQNKDLDESFTDLKLVAKNATSPEFLNLKR